MDIQQQLLQGQVLDNKMLMDIFKCSPQGGMRRSLKTNTLVLISDHVKSIYHDRWINNVFHYTGMGQRGNQSLNSAQNKTLAQSDINGVEVHLFEVEIEKEYIYQGRVVLSEKPYTEIQPDADGKDRDVVVFPLMLSRATPLPFNHEIFEQSQKARERKARKLSLDELREKASRSHQRAGERKVQSIQYERDPYVALFTKRRANGFCDLCLKEAPFIDKNGLPYLESHHIDWLSRGGSDSIENTVALCPNCHRKMHLLDDPNDKKVLMERIVRKNQLL
jgi:5-methylcytosine-specific restriction enzyme A